MPVPPHWPEPTIDDAVRIALPVPPVSVSAGGPGFVWGSAETGSGPAPISNPQSKALREMESLAGNIWLSPGRLRQWVPDAPVSVNPSPDGAGRLVLSARTSPASEQPGFGQISALEWEIDPARDDVLCRWKLDAFRPDGVTPIYTFRCDVLEFQQLPDGPWLPKRWTISHRIGPAASPAPAEIKLLIAPGRQADERVFVQNLPQNVAERMRSALSSPTSGPTSGPTSRPASHPTSSPTQ
jgi:hypothetical protein